MSDTLYAERSWNRLTNTVQLSAEHLKAGGRRVPIAELNLLAMADAHRHGRWLGGGGLYRPLEHLSAGPGSVPVARACGAIRPVRVKHARRFADELGTLALRLSGGPDAVAYAADQAARLGVPLWIARRAAHTPAGPVTVAVDRRLVRVDVFADGLPPVRLRGPYGLRAARPDPTADLTLTVGDERAAFTVRQSWRKTRRSVSVRTSAGHWELVWRDRVWSALVRDGRPAAQLSSPGAAGQPPSQDGIRPLAAVRHQSTDPMDALMAHFFGVACGLGAHVGQLRFGARREQPDPGSDAAWTGPWYTDVGTDSDDCGPAADACDGGGGSSDGGGGDSDGGGGDGGGGD
ncbi:hypothetical protein [Streptomyces alkaliterrae]|uniref:Uncharacterized protein n=1 Tax=Streptomyces alkaliterrae TaxID=2213162 RepID=A0A7W3ZPF6_9ACTN|nr:hypothetical protein [Streptomyces alkaliterrae]MBB1255447.1 hypothetical protein [Streptomyces alkaliterrae]MBB1259967.1 hypothetical protein [Streptomyces alkaliterrae]